jgi:hypothetical protein
MYQLTGDTWHGKFDPKRKKDGSDACLKDHQICAGFAKMFGSEIGINPETVSEIP